MAKLSGMYDHMLVNLVRYCLKQYQDYLDTKTDEPLQRGLEWFVCNNR